MPRSKRPRSAPAPGANTDPGDAASGPPPRAHSTALYWFVASVVLHAIILAAVTLVPPPQPAADAWTEMELELTEFVRAEEVPEPQPFQPTPQNVEPPVETEASPREPVNAANVAVPTNGSAVVDPGAGPSIQTPAVPSSGATLSRDQQLLIDPRNAARGATFAGIAPSQLGEASHAAASQFVPQSAEATARAFEQDLHAQAMTKTHVTRTRPRLVQQADGSYRYQGHAFEARVMPDGSVDFRDRPGASFDGLSTSGSFDMTDAFMRGAGQDPYSAERDWFMRETEELRGRLESVARAGATRTSLRGLRGRLAALWQDDARPVSARKRAVFGLWDEGGDDAEGQTARDTVMRFIHSEIPSTSPDAYTATEIRELNRNRHGSVAFAPY